MGTGDAAGNIAKAGGSCGKDAGDDGDPARLEPRFGLLQQPDFLLHARVSQTDRVEQAAAPIDAGRVDVAAAGSRAATFGRDRAAAFRRSPLEKADRCAPYSTCQYKRCGQLAAEEGG